MASLLGSGRAAASNRETAVLPGGASEFTDVGQAQAEILLASADAAIYIPLERRILLFHADNSGRKPSAAPVRFTTQRAFEEELSDLGDRLRAKNTEFVMKKSLQQDGILPEVRAMYGKTPPVRMENSLPAINGVVLADDFETGTISTAKWISNQVLGDPYYPAAKSCSARSGMYSADMVRGGALGASLACSSSYPANRLTLFGTANHSLLRGATSGSVEAYILLQTETNYDAFILMASDPNSSASGAYVYTGTYSSWFRISQDIKTWKTIGDLTMYSGMDVVFGFSSDLTGQYGFGARVDDISITAGTTAQAYALSVNQPGLGSGTVSSSPAGINCGSVCMASFSAGQVVTLTAMPNPGSAWGGWSGACSGSSMTCTVTMSQSTVVSAQFIQGSYGLSVLKAGDGEGLVTSAPSGINCGATCSSAFSAGQIVTLTAQPSLSSTWGGWSGDCSGVSTTCSVTVSKATSVTAQFNARPSTEMKLLGSQVAVSLTWKNPYNQSSGAGWAVKQMDQYGYFWFDSASNPEVFVKVLDFGGESFLVFHSSLSNFEYSVSFTVLRTGKTYVFKRDAFSVCGLADASTVKK